MTMTAVPVVKMDEVLPEEAWDQLAADPDAVLIDVRCAEERSASGIPAVEQIDRKLWEIEWPRDERRSVSCFLRDVVSRLKQTPSERLFFLSCSGARARTAAKAVAAVTGDLGQRLHVSPIVDGFEGRPGHPDKIKGWKAADLPWRRS
jgi:rhodanese-related sulfurtransferase